LRDLREVRFGVTLLLGDLLIPLTLLELVIVLIIPLPIFPLVPMIIIISRSWQSLKLLILLWFHFVFFFWF